MTGSSLENDGTVNLILADGANMTVSGTGMRVLKGGTLNIYSQSSGASEGRLTAQAGSEKYAGIGTDHGSWGECDITIHGGIIHATGNTRCPGIGSDDGSVTIYGGTVTAICGSSYSSAFGSAGEPSITR